MNGSVAAEQTPHLSHRDVRSFEIESFNPQLLKEEEEREGGFGVELVKEGRGKHREGKGETDRVGCTQEEGLSQVNKNGFMYILIHN